MTVTFMSEVIRRSGSANPNQFGRWFDAQTASWTHAPKTTPNANAKIGQVKATLGQKKWYRLAKGEFPLSKTALGNLARLFPRTYNDFGDGPDQLWRALWGAPEDLWMICGAVAYQMPFPDPDEEPEPFTGPVLSFDESLYNFETSLLSRHMRYGDPLELRDLAWSIAMYRLHQTVNRLAKTDGIGAYRCVRMCLDAPEIRWHLRSLSEFAEFSLYDVVNNELILTELDRLRHEPSYRASIGTEDIEAYTRNPSAFCSNEQRMELLRID
ncbi:hypothetical protein [Paraburkholderia hospita]|uniref:hypothetical protein n=1 Tax=Paraburkholderia hospita TaxID=169430 RepID=UPI000B347B24|nr:hypothetical protein [Paraburkholderia hospita]OUL72144.1 hypothetical protein CA603_46125 [Paraburkholderia hospita]